MAPVNVPRSTLIYTAVWVGVVVVCSTLVWAVISRAGEEVTSEEPPTRNPSTSVPRATGTTATAPTISPSDTPSTTPGSPTTPVDPSLTAVERTWSGVGGVVVVVCRGTAAELGTARPDTGFMTEVKDTGPQRVEVEFEGSGENDAKTRVRAECVNGEPSFEVDTD
jgi:hypothetical protein